jgi:hypothetical protein
MLTVEFVAVLSATLFAGAAIYINIAEHPARMECGTMLAATVFGPSYRRAAVMQIILALAAAIGGVSAWFLGGSRLWFVGAVLIFAVIPFECLPELADFDGERGDGFFEHTGSVTASLPTKRARGVHLGWKEVPV